MSALSNDRTTIVVWMNINKEQYKWISNWIMWKKKNEKKNRAQPKRISAHLETHCTTTWHRNGKKLPNHILFKLEFMMFITNDVDPWWMQMRNERAKIVPSHCRSEYQIECSASAVLVDILASWIRRESVRFALNIIDFMFVFITLFYIQKPIFPLINSMSSIVCDNHKPNTLNSCDSLKIFGNNTEKKISVYT